MVGYATAYREEWAVSSDSGPSIRDYWRELAKHGIRVSSYANEPEDADECAEIVVFADRPIDRLRQRYQFRDHAAVKDYLGDNPSLPGLLERAHDKIAEHFGSDVHAVLDLVKGFEADDDKRLFVFVQTDLDVDEALDRLDALYEQWWIKALSAVQPKLSIDVEYA